ncbi:fungal-specific transcription factor domain-containing protein [Roridomyces roridus]|uniref:Fungal-specific transcription factor domain-containing protein n=1 Tax=Roridomyces roridus TaxID=1738132 RepID=A0AAD7CES9_9AGAR|nr:fungal-specific transcription factor domain-containing protein [Roridomyces roridus]
MSEPPMPGSKKRRLQGACDICRSKKIRCDSARMPNNICSNCIAFSSQCTHSNKRMDSKQHSPTEDVPQAAPSYSSAQGQIEAILSPTTPYTPPKESSAILSILNLLATYARDLEREIAVLKEKKLDPAIDSSTTYNRPPTPNDSALTSVTDGYIVTGLTERLKGMKIDSGGNRFYGQSSDIMLVKTAIDLKDSGQYTQLADHLLAIKRPEYWDAHPWHEPAREDEDVYIFPEPDLMDSLLSLYWFHLHPFMPLLHRPTFEKSLLDGLHYRNSRFGATVLLVCSMASRYSDDPRVFSAHSEGTRHWELSAGWKWASQIKLVRQTYTSTPSLYDVQICCLAVIFLSTTGCPELSWVLLSLGIRLAQDVGAHRKRRYTGQNPAEEQLWTRTFWVLISIDILLSAAYGRPRATTSDDFDLDLPIECDDAYWETSDPADAFKQPAGVPSLMTYMIFYLKLLDILAFAHKTLYSLKRSKKRGAEADQWNQQVVAELDSAMNNWIDSLPDHLRWDPHREDFTFFQQSASLYAGYFHVRIQFHRLFLPSLHRSSPLAYSSLAVCANSSRSCAHIMDVQSSRGLLPLTHVQMALFDSSVILLLIIWSSKQTGMKIDASKELKDVHLCLNLLHGMERRWQSAGRLWDIIYAMLTTTGDVSGPVSLSRKRDRNSEGAGPSPETAVQEELLPIHSEDLSRLPQHFDFANSFASQGLAGYSQGLNEWSETLPGNPDSPANMLPSDFFTSGFDDSLFGQTPQWADASASASMPLTASWDSWIDMLR